VNNYVSKRTTTNEYSE